MPRDEECVEAQQLLLRALASQPNGGMTEGSLRRLTGIGTSMFQEAMGPLITTGQVAVSQSDGRQFKTTYYLVQQKEQSDSQEGPISPLAMQVLARLGDRAQGARALAKALELDVNVVQTALDELEAFGLVRRSQVAMLVIYRAARGP